MRGNCCIAIPLEDRSHSEAEVLTDFSSGGEGDLFGLGVDSLADPAVEAGAAQLLDIREDSLQAGLQDHSCSFMVAPAFLVEGDGLICIF